MSNYSYQKLWDRKFHSKLTRICSQTAFVKYYLRLNFLLPVDVYHLFIKLGYCYCFFRKIDTENTVQYQHFIKQFYAFQSFKKYTKSFKVIWKLSELRNNWNLTRVHLNPTRLQPESRFTLKSWYVVCFSSSVHKREFKINPCGNVVSFKIFKINKYSFSSWFYSSNVLLHQELFFRIN